MNRQPNDHFCHGGINNSSARSDDQDGLSEERLFQTGLHRWRRERFFQEPQRQKQEGAEMYRVFIEDTDEQMPPPTAAAAVHCTAPGKAGYPSCDVNGEV